MKSNVIPTVRQSNELIEASYKIATIGESRLIRLLLSQIQQSDEDFKIYKISAVDFAHVFGLNDRDGRIYELIYEASDALTSRKIRIRDGESWLLTNWLSSAKYTAGSGYIELRFDANLKPYLLQLKGYYTQYQLKRVINFKSIYSIRLFEMLKTEEFKANSTGQFKRSFEYDELREKLGIEQSEYLFFKDFRVRVIDTAKREINNNSDICIVDIDYSKKVGGRKITHIVFQCEKSKQGDLDLETGSPNVEEVKKEKKIPDDVKQMVSLGISEKTAMQWRKKYGVAQIVRNIGYTLAMKKAGKIRESESGFLASAIANDSGGGWELEQKKRETARKESERVEDEKTELEATEKEKERATRKILMDSFHSLPEVEQEAIRRLYEKQTNSIALSLWNRIKASDPIKPENNARTIADFAKFYKTYSANTQLPV